MSSLDSDSDGDTSSNWRDELQRNRVYITQRLEYKKISHFLLQAFIIDPDDDEEIKSQFLHPTSSDRNNKMVDKLLRKSEDHYNKFLDILGLKYPDLYKTITGKSPEPDEAHPFPSNPPDIIPGGRMDIPYDIMSVVIDKLDLKKSECENLLRQNMLQLRDLEDKSKQVQDLQIKIEEYQRRSERYESMERDMAALKDVVDQVKNENYKVCMRLVDINEDNSRLREHNMALRVENDKAKVELRKMESTVNSERSVSVRLRQRIQNGPTVKYIHQLQQEIESYKLKLARSESDKELRNNANDDTRLQILQSDKEEAIQMYAEASETLNKLREEFHSAETLRDKYLEENERLQLQVSALTDDCEMYKTRRDAVWQQLQEVEKERDQLMKERNEAQMTAQNHMDEKTKYRSQIRKLEEEHDKLSRTLREKENELLKLRKQIQVSGPRPLPENPPASDGSSGNTTESEPDPTSEWKFHRRRAYITKFYAEFLTKSEFGASMNPNALNVKSDGIFPEIPLARNYGNDCGKFTVGKWDKDEGDRVDSSAGPKDKRKNRIGIRKKRTDSRQAQAGSMNKRNNSETQSRTSSTDSPYQRKLGPRRLTSP